MSLANAIERHLGRVVDFEESVHLSGRKDLAEHDVRRILKWGEPESQPTQAEIDAAHLPAAKHFAKQTIKAEANRRILATMPDWKQRNLLARANELIRKEVKGTATAEESAELDALETAKWQVDTVRAASDAAEAAVDALTTVADVEAYDVTGW